MHARSTQARCHQCSWRILLLGPAVRAWCKLVLVSFARTVPCLDLTCVLICVRVYVSCCVAWRCFVQVLLRQADQR